MLKRPSLKAFIVDALVALPFVLLFDALIELPEPFWLILWVATGVVVAAIHERWQHRRTATNVS